LSYQNAVPKTHQVDVIQFFKECNTVCSVQQAYYDIILKDNTIYTIFVNVYCDKLIVMAFLCFYEIFFSVNNNKLICVLPSNLRSDINKSISNIPLIPIIPLTEREYLKLLFAKL